MTETEVTSDFVKALRLLHSRAKDSADVLKSMLDEVLRNKANQSGAKNDQKKPIKGIETAVIKSSLDYKKEIFDKRSSSVERFRGESFEYPPEKKRLRLDSPQTSRSTSSSPTPGSGGLIPLKPLSSSANPVFAIEETPSLVNVKVEDDSEATDIEDENTDAGEFAVEMGLACVQCKQIDIAPNNQLVECQECHNLYHQECHKPPLIDQDISDPRFVWYCAKCQKTMKKIAVKPQKNNTKSPVQTPTSTVSLVQAKDVSNPSLKTPVKGDNGSESRPIQPFKREPKVSVPNSGSQSTASNTSAKPIGLAALANITRTGSVSSSGQNNKPKNGNSLSSSSTAPQTTSNVALMASAEKRLQNLKKNKNNRQK